MDNQKHNSFARIDNYDNCDDDNDDENCIQGAHNGHPIFTLLGPIIFCNKQENIPTS